MRPVFTVFLQILFSGISSVFGAVLGYMTAGYLSFWIWRDLKSSNLAGLPAALIGLPMGFCVGALGGFWLARKMSNKQPLVLPVACLIALCMFALCFGFWLHSNP